MSKRSTFRPTVQVLETRKLMAGDALGVTGVDDPIVDGDQSTAVTVTGTTISGNTANLEGGGLWNSFTGGVWVASGDINGAADAGQTDDVYIDGRIITAENYDSASYFSEPDLADAADPVTDVADFNIWNDHRFAVQDASSTDAIFNEIGRDTRANTDGGTATWTFTGLAAGDY